MKSLKEWAEQNKTPLHTAYRKFNKGEIEGAYKTAKGNIIISEVTQEIEKLYELYNEPAKIIKEITASEVRTRRNKSAVSDGPEPLKNIEDGITPFKIDGSYVSCEEPCRLCQKAYYNFDVFRNTIDLMTEFSVTNIQFRGGSKKSRELFKAIFKKVGLWNLQDMFYREDFRSGNVFFYRYDVEVSTKDVEKLMQVFGAEEDLETKVNEIKTILPKNKKVKFPARYVILNPAEIRAGGNIDFSVPTYYKYLSQYELARLRKPKTEEDKEVFENFDPETQKLIKNQGITEVAVPLDTNKIYASFYKKQSYEPFSVPMGYPVLRHINAKAELSKMDNAIARTMQQAILLITLGYESQEGKYVYPKPIADAIKQLFENESVARVLISDFSTKAEFVIPQIADILDPKKYEVLDRDINIGLNNILVGGEKFSNQAMKVQVFIERLRHVREQFKNDFLLPEIKRIAKELGLKNYPTPYFEEINLKDELEFAKVYTRLVELGVLTPEEGINAIETGTLPTPEESIESQKKFKEYKAEQLYQPLVGGGIGDQMALTELGGEIKVQQDKVKQNNKGRPSGTSAPKRKMTPVGGSFSLNKLKEIFGSITSLTELTKKILKTENEEVVNSLVEVIISNEKPENWTKATVNKYKKTPTLTNEELISEIEEIRAEHQIPSFLLASALYHSQGE